MIRKKLVWAGILILVVLLWPGKAPSQAQTFKLQETTIEAVQNAYKTGRLNAHQLVELYLKRIDAYDKKGPAINSIITINPKALDEADRLDAAFKRSGFTGPLHGIPVIVKDQFDVKGMPTTLGSILFEGYLPDRDSFVAEKLRKAGAIILGKTTLGELGGGDTHGSLFGSTRNPYALDRTVGGSSGGSGRGFRQTLRQVPSGEEGLRRFRGHPPGLSAWGCERRRSDYDSEVESITRHTNDQSYGGAGCIQSIRGPERQSSIQVYRRALARAGIRKSVPLRARSSSAHFRRYSLLPVPPRAGRTDDELHEGPGRQQARCHRIQVRRASADAHQGRRESSFCEHERSASSQYVSRFRSCYRCAGRFYSRQPSRRNHLHGTAL